MGNEKKKKWEHFMEWTRKNKKIVALFLLALLAFLVYFFLFRSRIEAFF